MSDDIYDSEELSNLGHQVGVVVGEVGGAVRSEMLPVRYYVVKQMK